MNSFFSAISWLRYIRTTSGFAHKVFQSSRRFLPWSHSCILHLKGEVKNRQSQTRYCTAERRTKSRKKGKREEGKMANEFPWQSVLRSVVLSKLLEYHRLWEEITSPGFAGLRCNLKSPTTALEYLVFIPLAPLLFLFRFYYNLRAR